MEIRIDLEYVNCNIHTLNFFVYKKCNVDWIILTKYFLLTIFTLIQKKYCVTLVMMITSQNVNILNMYIPIPYDLLCIIKSYLLYRCSGYIKNSNHNNCINQASDTAEPFFNIKYPEVTLCNKCQSLIKIHLVKIFD